MKRVTAAVAGAVLLAALLPTQAGAAPIPGGAPAAKAGAEQLGNYDARAASAAKPAATAQRALTAAAKPGSAVRELRESLGIQGIVDIDKVTGTPRRVAKLDGFLTKASTRKPEKIALDYVKAHSGVFGLNAAAVAGLSLRKNYTDIEGVQHLSFSQSVGGVPVFGNGLKAHVAKDGRLIQVDGSPLAALPATPGTAKLTAAKAREAAVADVFGTSAATVKNAASGVTTFSDGGNARPVLFQTVSGPRLAWQTLTMDQGFLHVVDAASGAVLFRQNLVASDHGQVWRNYPGAPAGGTQQNVNLNKWLPLNAPKLDGNVAHVYSDVNDDNAAGATEEVAPAAKRSFDYPFTDFTAQVGPPCAAEFKCSWDPTVPNSWQANRAQNAVQLYYFLGTWHDHLAAKPIGFTRAAGNFEAVDGDAVQAQSMDGANTADGLPDGDHVNNANMSTPPDGTSPTMQMYLFVNDDQFVAGNSGDEADIVYHEYGHGLSNRLVVDANGVSGLNQLQSTAMGEAWGDWYAMDYLVDQGLETDSATDGDVRVGRYVLSGETIRSQSLDCPVGSTSGSCTGNAATGDGGYTYGDYAKIYAGGPEEHADGEIWAQTLWDLRTAIGSKKAQSLVTRAMELSPAEPSFLDMRNSILQADLVVNGGKQQKNIWKVFAARGMGFFAGALSGGDAAPVEDFSTPPPADTPRGTLTGTVHDRDSGAPVNGATIGFGGHTSGFAGDYVATSAADGTYTIEGIIPGTYPKVFARGAGYDAQSRTVSVGSGTTALDWQVRRDWAAAGGGASVVSATGPDYTEYGCGPIQLLDQSQSTGWGSDVAAAGQNVVIKLPAAVNIAELVINPSATCGDGVTSSTGKFRVETSPDNAAWTVAATGQFPNGTVTPTTVPLTAGGTSVAYLRFTMLTTQGQDAGLCPNVTLSGCVYMDSTELAVYGAPAS